MKVRHLLFAAAFWMVVILMSCAHVENVAKECQGTVTPQLVADSVAALASNDYEAALIQVGMGIAPCLLVNAVKEVVQVAETAKAEATPVSIAIKLNGKAWLSRHDK